jgi:hypothetical protein
VIPKNLLLGWDFLHASATHVVRKLSDSKGRVCSDPRSSGLNDGTDLRGPSGAAIAAGSCQLGSGSEN